MGFPRHLATIFAAGMALAAAFPATAQFSDSYNFLRAVRDRDGQKTMDYLNKPGQPALNTRDPGTGETALHIIVKRHDMQWLMFLLSRRPDLEAKDKNGMTALMDAAQLGDVDEARLLIQVGADVNTTDDNGETPLILAVQNHDAPMVRLLVGGGADPSIADTIAGKSARDYAQEDRRSTALVRILDEAKPAKRAAPIMGPTR